MTKTRISPQERSARALLGGASTVVLLVALTRLVVGESGVERDSTMALVLQLLLGVLYALLGGYLASSIVRRAEGIHAVVLGGLLALVMVASPHLFGMRPTWYWIAQGVLTLPAVLVGAWLRVRQRRTPYAGRPTDPS